MEHINIQKLAKSFSDNDVIKNITFHVEEGERIGIVGSNGTGKTTLLHIIAGLEEADSGVIKIHPDASVQILRQELSNWSSYDTILELNNEEKHYLKLLNFDEHCLDSLDTLSGGERMKLALSKTLALSPNLLLLDEPTNNLDYNGIQAFINLLWSYQGTIITVSHDRYFLDAIATKIIEIENGISTEYYGNYTDYREEKKRLYQEKLHRYEENQKQQKNIEEAIDQIRQWSQKAHKDSTLPDSSGLKFGVKEKKRAKALKMDRKIKHDIKRLERLKVDGDPKPEKEKTIYFEIQNTKAQGKRLLEAIQISKSFDEIHLFSDSSFTISKGEKIAIWGNNGCGKTTFLEIVLGNEPLDSGDLWLSKSSKPYVIEQNFEAFSGRESTLEYLSNRSLLLTGLERTILNNMGITKRQLEQPVRTLSYGEQMKIKLILPILEHKDFIIMDEPTNHLDLHARELLEDTLNEYSGSLFIVSHDIYLLKRICNKVLVFNEGRLQKLECSFAEFID